MPKKLLTALSCTLLLGLSGCGFALRGTQDALQVASQYKNVSITLDDTPESFTLKQSLVKHLQMRGIQNADGTNNIRLQNVRFRQYELVGTLTEARLVLMADATYQLGTQTHNHSLQVESSYQHNEASVATTDSQGNKSRAWLYDSLAERIAEQYRAIAQTPKQSPQS